MKRTLQYVAERPNTFEMAEPMIIADNAFKEQALDLFHYNAHVGIDVGGRHNNKAMACLGHGFRKPSEGLVFRPEEISVEVQKVEPIYTDFLYRGLLQLFEIVHTELEGAGCSPDLERTLFFRDGRLGGDGDEWNEMDALRMLHSELLDRNWIGADSTWTVVEILKRAEEWRLFRDKELEFSANLF